MTRFPPTYHPEDSGGGGLDDGLSRSQVIRGAGEARPLFGPRLVVSHRVEKLRDEVASLERELAAKRAEAEQLVTARLREAEAEVERAKEEAREKAASEASLDLEGILGGIARQHRDKLLEFEDKVPDLCLRIASKILQLELKDRDRADAAWRGLLRRAMETVRHKQTVTIQVHPDYASILERVASELATTIPMNAVPMVKANGELGRGEALVVTPAGQIEISIDQRLSEMEAEA